MLTGGRGAIGKAEKNFIKVGYVHCARIKIRQWNVLENIYLKYAEKKAQNRPSKIKFLYFS